MHRAGHPHLRVFGSERRSGSSYTRCTRDAQAHVASPHRDRGPDAQARARLGRLLRGAAAARSADSATWPAWTTRGCSLDAIVLGVAQVTARRPAHDVWPLRHQGSRHRATRPGGGRRIDDLSFRAQVLKPAGPSSPSEAGPRLAMQPLGSLREAQGGTQAAVCKKGIYKSAKTRAYYGNRPSSIAGHT